MIEVFSYQLTYLDMVLIGLVAVMLGMGKTGVQGVAMLAIPIMAIIFGGRNSSGVILPLLIFADLFAVKHYHQHAHWSYLTKLLPFVIVGVVIGTFTGHYIDDTVFRQIMAVIIFSSVAVMLWRERNANQKIPTSFFFTVTIGVVGGFATMIGNVAGPILALYLLAMRLPKNEFIGTAAWFFLVVNVSKVPLHVFVWETITLNSFMLNLTLIPLIAAGAYLGIRITRRIPEEMYRWFVIVMIVVAAMILVF